VPALPELTCDDCTLEALGSLLHEQEYNRILVNGAEGTAFSIICGRYADQVIADLWCKGYTGEELKVHRKSRGREHVASPALSAAVAVQPEVLDRVAAVRELRENGFLARWFYSRPASILGHRDANCQPVPS